MKSINISSYLQQTRLFRHFTFSWLKKSTIVEIISFFFVILFLYTGISKLLDFEMFKVQLEDSPVLEPVAVVVAWGLPITEFIVSIILFFPRYRLKGLYASFILMLIFTGYVTALLTTSTELPCSCGGIIEELSWQGHLIFNSSLILLSFVALKLERSNKRINNKPYQEPFLTSHA